MNDKDFIRADKVPMTKEEIRYITAGYLELSSASSMLDIGSGTGSVSFEALFANNDLLVTAVEINEKACEVFNKNLENFEKMDASIRSRVTLINDKAPTEKVTGSFDRVFVGGSGSNIKEVIDFADSRMSKNGILVMNFITIENFYKSLEYLTANENFTRPEGSLISVNKLSDIGPYRYMKPQNPAFILKTIKI